MYLSGLYKHCLLILIKILRCISN